MLGNDGPLSDQGTARVIPVLMLGEVKAHSSPDNATCLSLARVDSGAGLKSEGTLTGLISSQMWWTRSLVFVGAPYLAVAIIVPSRVHAHSHQRSFITINTNQLKMIMFVITVVKRNFWSLWNVFPTHSVAAGSVFTFHLVRSMLHSADHRTRDLLATEVWKCQVGQNLPDHRNIFVATSTQPPGAPVTMMWWSGRFWLTC